MMNDPIINFKLYISSVCDTSFTYGHDCRIFMFIRSGDRRYSKFRHVQNDER